MEGREFERRRRRDNLLAVQGILLKLAREHFAPLRHNLRSQKYEDLVSEVRRGCEEIDFEEFWEMMAEAGFDLNREQLEAFAGIFCSNRNDKVSILRFLRYVCDKFGTLEEYRKLHSSLHWATLQEDERLSARSSMKWAPYQRKKELPTNREEKKEENSHPKPCWKFQTSGVHQEKEFKGRKVIINLQSEVLDAVSKRKIGILRKRQIVDDIFSTSKKFEEYVEEIYFEEETAEETAEDLDADSDTDRDDKDVLELQISAIAPKWSKKMQKKKIHLRVSSMHNILASVLCEFHHSWTEKQVNKQFLQVRTPKQNLDLFGLCRRSLFFELVEFRKNREIVLGTEEFICPGTMPRETILTLNLLKQYKFDIQLLKTT